MRWSARIRREILALPVELTPADRAVRDHALDLLATLEAERAGEHERAIRTAAIAALDQLPRSPGAILVREHVATEDRAAESLRGLIEQLQNGS